MTGVPSRAPARALTYTNPLPATLRRFARELSETAAEAGITLRELESCQVEGGTGAAGKLTMLAGAARNLRVARLASPLPNVSLWPSLGLLEARLLGTARHRNAVIIHDPVPLRRQVGYSRASAAFAARASTRRAPVVIALSRDAAIALRRMLPRHQVAEALHPVLRETRTWERPGGPPRVLVAGQYKAQRDLALLKQLGPWLRSEGAETVIAGRGWPEIPGWDVVNGFIAEADLDRMLGEATVVLLPYRRYYQSGIAIRAWENGTATVSPRVSFAASLFGADSALLFDRQDPAAGAKAALEFALSAGPGQFGDIAAYRARAAASWAAVAGLLSSGGAP